MTKMITTTDDPLLFSSRPTRTQVCARCGGEGTVAQPYYLTTNPPSMGPVRGAPEGAVHAFVVGSAFIHEATREASEIARRAQRAVAFEFMERLVVVRPDDDPEQVWRAWWTEFYGQTFEQSVASR